MGDGLICYCLIILEEVVVNSINLQNLKNVASSK